ncbi:c-type cytochrome [Pseudomonas sp. SDO5532_S415]
MKIISASFSVSVFIGLITLVSVKTALAQEGDPKRGEAVFQQCSICHQIGPDATNGIGPMLTNVLNRKMGSVKDYSYDTGLQKASMAGVSWDKDKIFSWLGDPQGYIKSVAHDETATTRMTVKVSDEQARRDVIAYIATFSK